MRVYFCFSVVLANVISTNLVKHDQNPHNGNNTEAFFAGVVNNISRVNNVLRELVRNYEQLQKVYKSQESLDENESTDDEIDEVYKDKKNHRAESKSDTVTTGYSATQMVVWSNEKYKTGSSEEHESNDNTEHELLHKEAKLDSKYDDSSESDDEEKLELKKQTGNKTPIQVKHSTELKPAELIPLHSYETIHQKEEQDEGKTLFESDHKPPKTRYSKISHSKSDKSNNLNIKKLFDDFVSDNAQNDKHSEKPKPDPSMSKLDFVKIVEKNLFSKIFSPKIIWNDDGKSVQTQNDNEKSHSQLRKESKSLRKQRSKAKDSKTTLVEDTQVREDRNIRNKSVDTSDSDNNEKKEFEANVLREAYGNACMNAVIHKCFKVCKAVNKQVCLKFNCKREYKDKFKIFGKRGCIKEFTGKNIEDNDGVISDVSELTVKKEIVITKLRAKDKDNSKESDDSNDGKEKGSNEHYPVSDSKDRLVKNKFANITRMGYFQTCLPHIQTEWKRSGDLEAKEADLKNATATGFMDADAQNQNINILRNKYERACKKLSYEKCHNACEYAYTQICESYTCKKSRRRTYRKSCKTKCKAAYSYSRDSSGSDNSDSSGSSDSSDSSGSSSGDSDIDKSSKSADRKSKSD